MLAHRLFHRAAHLNETPDRETARRLVDERLVPAPDAREAAAEEARRLCLAALGERRPGGMLEGRVETWVRTSVRRRDGSLRLVVVPTLVQNPGGERCVVAFAPAADRKGITRLGAYRRAAEGLYGVAVAGVLVSPRGVTPDPGRGRPARR